MKLIFCVSLLCPACLIAASGDAAMAGPRLGYIFDDGPRVLRLVEGIPGASLLGEAVDTGFPLDAAVVSPDRSYVLAIAAEGRSACVLTVNAGWWTRREFAGAHHPVDRLALSPAGSAAALYDASAGVVQVVTGLPEAPVVERAIPVSALDRMAVSDDGRLLLVSAGDRLTPVLVFDDDARGRAIPVPGPASAMIFRPQSHDALIAAAGGITFVREVGTGGGYQLLNEKPDTCTALSFSRQGDRFFAAYEDGTIFSHDFTGGGSSTIDCQCVPTILQPMNQDLVFRLTQGDKGPMLLLDGTSNRVVFVARGDR